MRISNARLQGNELILTLPNPLEASREVYKFKPGNYDIVPHRERRSLDANAYCWTLIHKIAEKVHEPAVEIYRGYIRDVGCKTSVVCVLAEDLETEVDTFLSGHIGRMVDIEESKLPGCVNIHKKYGSSSFDVQQMSAFIDLIKQDCVALDIDVRTPEEIDSLLKGWSINGKK